MGDALTTIKSERLQYFRDMLVASGWEHDGFDGWLAPEGDTTDNVGRNFREVVAVSFGKGHLSLWYAVAVQIKADFAYLRGMKAADGMEFGLRRGRER